MLSGSKTSPPMWLATRLASLRTKASPTNSEVLDRRSRAMINASCSRFISSGSSPLLTNTASQLTLCENGWARSSTREGIGTDAGPLPMK
uniref:Uncharacterized protein n=1 Tax=Arundo donax TaxID=35708 RepID=A0A0A9BCX3_ARUDO